MNNQEFRSLLLNTPARAGNGAESTPKPGPTPGGSLGSRMRSSIPMTPRNVKGSTNIDFARQIAERNAGSKPQKKFRSIAAPKGTKLAAGYRDRTQGREENEADDKEKRVKALEEAMKLGQIERETFEQLVEDITGGDISSTHLVKGLDRKLLERVRRGEDVFSGATKNDEPGPDIDEEFEKLEEKELAPVVREKTEKKGDMAPPPPPVSGVKRSRDAILAEMKAARKAAAEAAAAEKAAKYPSLGPGFRKIGEKMETSRIEIDDNGREVLIVRDENGKEKRKIRKMKVGENVEPAGLDKNAKPLDYGLKIPELLAAPPPPEEEEDEDIFEGAGVGYNPLADLGEAEDVSSSDEEEDGELPTTKKSKLSVETAEPQSEPEAEEGELSASPQPSASISPPTDKSTMPPPSVPRRNYFADTSSTTTTETPPVRPLIDSTVLAALEKVRKLDPNSSLLETEEETRLKKRAAILAAADRDLEDMDMGFGSSRFDDAEEMDMEGGERIKLSEWKGSSAGDDEGRGKKGGKQRKRGSKKRKGDKNSAADVLKVIEKRKEAKTLG
ncbi:hypothetical protein K432DRAFT_74920 [Lepidopterella palustris CBS 459.81]|uniref:RED-like N-terminal domain-containing protein n=1 Tax=Lepidopterella palustris CBS 459.81 TaxID=1314670 RepID=A0A8E2E894_9PEZI|nr:hypothetical protein K432DRAFT_74920 [Lepidopterella palustris CBS 459.81]